MRPRNWSTVSASSATTPTGAYRASSTRSASFCTSSAVHSGWPSSRPDGRGRPSADRLALKSSGTLTAELRTKMRCLASTTSNISPDPPTFSDDPRNRNPCGFRA